MKIEREGYGTCKKCEAEEVRSLYTFGDHKNLCGFCLAKVLLEEEVEVKIPSSIKDIDKGIVPYVPYDDEDKIYKTKRKKPKYIWVKEDEDKLQSNVYARYVDDAKGNYSYSHKPRSKQKGY